MGGLANNWLAKGFSWHAVMIASLRSLLTETGPTEEIVFFFFSSSFLCVSPCAKCVTVDRPGKAQVLLHPALYVVETEGFRLGSCTAMRVRVKRRQGSFDCGGGEVAAHSSRMFSLLLPSGPDPQVAPIVITLFVFVRPSRAFADRLQKNGVPVTCVLLCTMCVFLRPARLWCCAF